RLRSLVAFPGSAGVAVTGIDESGVRTFRYARVVRREPAERVVSTDLPATLWRAGPLNDPAAMAPQWKLDADGTTSESGFPFGWVVDESGRIVLRRCSRPRGPLHAEPDDSFCRERYERETLTLIRREGAL